MYRQAKLSVEHCAGMGRASCSATTRKQKERTEKRWPALFGKKTLARDFNARSLWLGSRNQEEESALTKSSDSADEESDSDGDDSNSENTSDCDMS